MTVEVRYFASLVDRTGVSSEPVEIEAGASIAELWQRLVERHPRLAGLGFRPLVACDRSYVDWQRPLEGVREVAFLPPVSGG